MSCVPYWMCIFVHCASFERGVILWCVLFVCLIVVPLSPGKTPFAVKINNNNTGLLCLNHFWGSLTDGDADRCVITKKLPNSIFNIDGNQKSQNRGSRWNWSVLIRKVTYSKQWRTLKNIFDTKFCPRYTNVRTTTDGVIAALFWKTFGNWSSKLRCVYILVVTKLVEMQTLKKIQTK
jgi:hypothetical protein